MITIITKLFSVPIIDLLCNKEKLHFHSFFISKREHQTTTRPNFGPISIHFTLFWCKNYAVHCDIKPTMTWELVLETNNIQHYDYSQARKFWKTWFLKLRLWTSAKYWINKLFKQYNNVALGIDIFSSSNFIS